eukprot:CAMPEP_0204349980 /NCGR_PEP_ID=MMETSP0469-20131031/29964_1 /ASSEMBLY_ACC=CAM_ASM_000384 /TAXON_ID=2969 /ORGANISM="Oxyrrhis marina" /LENGTH=54 /DNA_ID=CAMNT_0051336259 /DNA_START=123 /DNA_END=284 /DNA_ORIENTATION=+
MKNNGMGTDPAGSHESEASCTGPDEMPSHGEKAAHGALCVHPDPPPACPPTGFA